MHPVNICVENLNVLFQRDKKYNPEVLWTELIIYFRYKGKLIKRNPLILTKKRITNDYKDLLNLFLQQDFSEEEKKEEINWTLCGSKNLTSFKKIKKNMYRFCFDNPDADQIMEDRFLNVEKNEMGYKPYSVEVIVNEKDLNINNLKKIARDILKKCYDIKVKEKDINFIKNISEQDLRKKWVEYKSQKDNPTKENNNQRIVFNGQAAKEMFGEDIKRVVIENNGIKTTVYYENGEIYTEVRPKLKFIKKKNKRKNKISGVK